VGPKKNGIPKNNRCTKYGLLDRESPHLNKIQSVVLFKRFILNQKLLTKVLLKLMQYTLPPQVPTNTADLLVVGAVKTGLSSSNFQPMEPSDVSENKFPPNVVT